jgi:hypothetical protein
MKVFVSPSAKAAAPSAQASCRKSSPDPSDLGLNNRRSRCIGAAFTGQKDRINETGSTRGGMAPPLN